MRNTLFGALAYAGIVFGVGVIVGVARTLWLMPEIGELRAILIELPLMLAFAWFVCGAVLRWFPTPRSTAHRLALGAVAFVLLMLGEFAISVLWIGTPLQDHSAAYLSPSGLISVFGQLAFAAFPLVRLADHRCSIAPARPA
jgi:hypothetical protein